MPDERGVWRRRFPAPFLEMAWAGGVLVLMLVWRNSQPKAGLLACGALALLAAGRILLQTLRDEGAAEDSAVRMNWLILLASSLGIALAIGLH